jgi:hypothetical protein
MHTLQPGAQIGRWRVLILYYQVVATIIALVKIIMHTTSLS